MMQLRLVLVGMMTAGWSLLALNTAIASNPQDITSNSSTNLVTQELKLSLQSNINIVGSYKCEGRNADGSIYKGTVDITKKGGVYYLKWLIGKQKFTGVGILQGNVLSVSYYGSFSGVVAYRVESNSRLFGQWTTATQGKINTETLTR